MASCRMCIGRWACSAISPTYALGNVYAGCLNAALREAVPDLDRFLEQGDATPVVEWLRENMQHTAAFIRPAS